jgi:hypothetical protein
VTEVFASREIWKVHVCPVAAGQVTEIGANIAVFARQPVILHLAVAFCLLTTKVVVTSVSLLITVWAGAAVAINDNAAKVRPPIISNACESLIALSSWKAKES